MDEKNITISFKSLIPFSIGTYIEVEYIKDDKTQKGVFEVKSLRVKGNRIIKHKAISVGYSNNRDTMKKTYSPLTFINCPITEIIDEERIKSLNRSKNYC